MVVFPESVADAIVCATAMHRVVTALDPDDPAQLRIGISTGEVAEADGDFQGMPIVEAARLEAAAEPGQTLTTAVVRALVGTRARLAVPRCRRAHAQGASCAARRLRSHRRRCAAARAGGRRGPRSPPSAHAPSSDGGDGRDRPGNARRRARRSPLWARRCGRRPRPCRCHVSVGVHAARGVEGVSGRRRRHRPRGDVQRPRGAAGPVTSRRPAGAVARHPRTGAHARHRRRPHHRRVRM